MMPQSLPHNSVDKEDQGKDERKFTNAEERVSHVWEERRGDN